MATPTHDIHQADRVPLPDRLSRLISVGVAFVALLAGLYLRLDGLSGPPYESHAFRQTQTLSTIEDFHEHGIDLLHPKTIYMGSPGTFVLELPLFQAVAAILYDWLGPHIQIVRLLNTVLGLGSACLIYGLTRLLLDRTTGAIAAMIYWLAPLNIVYQRSMLIDPTAVFGGLLCFYLVARLIWEPGTNAANASVRRPGWYFAVLGLAMAMTALIKALYLWPTVLLVVTGLWQRQLRFNSRIWGVLAVFAIAGACFLAWNAYAAQVNAASPFTDKVKPTSHLGFSSLVLPSFYSDQLFHRPKRWLGVGVLLYPVGLWAALVTARRRTVAHALRLLIIIPPTYLVLFADINRPHEYYQLIITPFLAIVPAWGLICLAEQIPARLRCGLGIILGGILVGSSIFVYKVWLKFPRPDPQVVRFQQLCAGRFPARSPAMVFISSQMANGHTNSYIPEFIYAANLWGYGKTVDEIDKAKPIFEKFFPAFEQLDYVVFYGTARPDWMPTNRFRLSIEDTQNRLFVYQNSSLP